MGRMKGFLNEWGPVIVMVAVDFALAVVNVLLKKVLDQGMNHLALITYRQSTSAVFLAPIGYFWERKSRPKLTPAILCQLFFSAIVGATVTQYLFLLGIQYTSATLACAFINMVPVITFIMALPFRLETVNMKSNAGRAKVVGMLVCVGGAMLLTLYKGLPLITPSSSPVTTHTINTIHSLSPATKTTRRWAIGSIALVSGALLWSSWFLLQAKINKQYPCQYSSITLMCFFSAIQSAALSLIIYRSKSIWLLSGKVEILTVIYAGMVGSGLCYVGMSWCVKKRGPVFTAAFSPLIEIIVAVFDVSTLHEQLHLGSVLGSILVVAGLYILLWGKSKEVQNCAPKPFGAGKENADQEVQSQVVPVAVELQYPQAQSAYAHQLTNTID